MGRSIFILASLCFSFASHAAPPAPLGKCASYPKLAALTWAHQLFESDIETAKNIGAEPLSIEMKAPVMQEKSKNPAGVAEVYSIDWKLRYKNKNWNYSAAYFYDESCHRLKDAEFKAGKGAEVKAEKRLAE